MQKLCVICAAPFDQRPANRTCCSYRCSQERKRRHDGNRRRAEMRPCLECGRSFLRSRLHHSLCSKDCAVLRNRRRTAEHMLLRRGLCRVCGVPTKDRMTCSDVCFAALHPGKVLEIPVLVEEQPQSCGPVEDPDEAARIRRLHCRRYEKCLTVAAIAGWVNFSCSACPVNDLMTQDEIDHENRELARVYRQREGYVYRWREIG